MSTQEARLRTFSGTRTRWYVDFRVSSDQRIRMSPMLTVMAPSSGDAGTCTYEDRPPLSRQIMHCQAHQRLHHIPG